MKGNELYLVNLSKNILCDCGYLLYFYVENVKRCHKILGLSKNYFAVYVPRKSALLSHRVYLNDIKDGHNQRNKNKSGVVVLYPISIKPHPAYAAHR